jgi:hypothetical protein
MYTFSQLVDEMVSETKRPDLVTEIGRYVNQTIREVHFTEDRGGAVFYHDNFREELLVANVESGMTWQIPEPTQFQKLQVVRFMSVYDDDGRPKFAHLVRPSRRMNDFCEFYYQSGNIFVFSGYGGLNSAIALGWYEFPRGLVYKSEANRPASFDIELGWSYADGINTDELQAAARELTTNWLLMRWPDVISEGVRAKVFKRLSDDVRARTSYSLYQSLRHGLWTSEVSEIYGG